MARQFCFRPLQAVLGARRWVSNKSGNADILQELRNRGLVAQISAPEAGLHERIQSGLPITLYCGADPTAPSLHLGNVMPLMILLHFYVRGHNVVGLVGGATGKVGDPSGRTTERDKLEDDMRTRNVETISLQIQRFFRNGLLYWQSKNGDNNAQPTPGKLIQENNYFWWKDVKLLDFLAQYGRHIRIQSMLSRDSVSTRLASKDGLGFNEFTYQILQAYDFYHLNESYNVTVQVGGNDQWGNITAGVDFIKRVKPKLEKEKWPFGITVPLLTTANGQKFGKSAGNAIFIDPDISTPFDIFQYFYNTEDADVDKLLKVFTFLKLEEIQEHVATHTLHPHLRQGQRLLGREVVDLLYGPGHGKDAELVSEIIFGSANALNSMPTPQLIEVCQRCGVLSKISRKEVPDLMELLIKLTNCSRTEANRKIKQGSIYLHSSKMKTTQNIKDLTPYLIDDRLLILRIGKRKCLFVEMTD